MAILVKFNKTRAQYLVQCLASGTPIQPAGNGWTGSDLLALPGACLFSAINLGPDPFWVPENLNSEHRPPEPEEFFNGLRAAVEFYSHLVRLVQVGDYDDHYDVDVRALVTQKLSLAIGSQVVIGQKANGEAQ